MNTIKHVLLKGNERFLDHTKSVVLYGKLYWRKSDKKLNVGDIVYLFMSGKGHYQIRYKLEVTSTSVPRQDEKCWLAPFFLIMIVLSSLPLQPCMKAKNLDIMNWNR